MSDTFTVSITPNYSTGLGHDGKPILPAVSNWDISIFRDLNFVIQDVQLNSPGTVNPITQAPPTNTYSVLLTEYYVSTAKARDIWV